MVPHMARWFLLAFSLAVSSTAQEVDSCPARPCNQAGSHTIPDDETLVCNIGSACREEYLAANGSETEIWPDATIKVNMDRIRTEKNRLRHNKYQPAIVPKYTELGYKKEKMPAAALKHLMAWYKMASRGPLLREEREPQNTYVNHWKLDVQIMPSTNAVQQRLFKDLQPLMEDWVGVPLKPSACYGIRVYPRGSVLANHVDRIDTHVVSGIINVDQTNLDSDWPLYVRGHDGVARNITMQPGEIIFYESASVIHGRPTPLEGEAFANIFVHFAPVEGWSITAEDIDRASRAEASRAAGAKARQAAEGARVEAGARLE